MAKSSITNITTTQTFQNWFDKTNEMVDLFRAEVVTASALGDDTTGNATLVGTFEATDLKANDELFSDHVRAYNSANNVTFHNPITMDATTNQNQLVLKYTAGGPRIELTDNTDTWTFGMEDSVNTAVILDTGSGDPKLRLLPNGTLQVVDLYVRDDVLIEDALTVRGTFTANNIVTQGGSGSFTGSVVGNVTGDLTGDVYHPNAAGGNGSGKVLENGGPAANIPATFFGNVQGTVSSLINHDTDSLEEGADNLYFTNARAQGAFSDGTGVTFGAADEDGIVPINIGQAVGTGSNVTFSSLVVNNATDANLGTIQASGDITAFANISDIAMKENINPIENALDKVLQLGGYTFNYKSRPGEEMSGVMAQEIEKVVPGIVYKTVNPDTNEETYAVRHGNLVGLLIEAIKELSAKVGK